MAEPDLDWFPSMEEYPTKFTPSFAVQMLDKLSTGLSIEKAAALAGASRASFYRWRSTAEDYQERLESGESIEELLAEDPLAEAKLTFFFEKVPEAQAKRVAKAHEVLENALERQVKLEMPDGTVKKVPDKEAIRTAKWLAEHYEDLEKPTQPIQHGGGVERRGEDSDSFRLMVAKNPEAAEKIQEGLAELSLEQREEQQRHPSDPEEQ